MSIIHVENISKSFWDRSRGEINAVLPTSFQLERGEIFGLLGPNGAGKSTLLRMLATILKPTSGNIFVNNYDVRNDPVMIKKSIGFLSGSTRLYGRLTPRELLHYFGALYEMESDEIQQRCDEIFKLLDMTDFIDVRIEKLSTGQTQKTSIARCILHDPPVFILDEPTLGLDILTSRSILEFIRLAAARGKTVILSTHYMEEAELLCNRIAFMHQGQIIAIDDLKGYQKKSQKNHLGEIFLHYISSDQSHAGQIATYKN